MSYQESVEQAVVEHFNTREQAECCYYLENSLFNGVLGLLIWDAIFAPLPNAFFNPFQHRPSDFYAHDFCDKRKHFLDQVWSSIANNNDIRARVSECWQARQGLMNPLVNWQELNFEIVDLALQRIPFSHWRAIFDRILSDLGNNRAGFPDLVYFPINDGYRLIEVKGPGDSLQKNQQRWMQFFHEQEIPHAIARVTWIDR